MANFIDIKSKYRPEIDGLKAFAISCVIINHFNKTILPSGFLGVDIFFVISGFVITSSLCGKSSKNFKEFICNFYIRRIIRILPALLIFVILMSFFICLFNPDPNLSLRTGLFSIFGISNIFLYIKATDYFAQTSDLNIFTHTWSLGVEGQFYLIFPLIIWFSGFAKKNNSTKKFFLIMFLLTFISLFIFFNFYSINQSAAYFLMPPRFWEIASGSMLFIGIQNKNYILKKLENICPLIIFIFMILVMFIPITKAKYSIIFIVFLTGILINSLKEETFLFRIFTKKEIIYFGLISYSLYLWHWGILAISRWTVGVHLWTIPFQIILIIFISNFSYKYIENRFRQENYKNKKLDIFIKTLFSSLISALTLIGLSRFLSNKIYLGSSKSFNNDNVSKFIPSTRKKCKDFTINQDCLVKSKEINKKILLVGDSYAGHIIPLIGSIHNKVGLGSIISTSGVYPHILNSDNERMSLKKSLTIGFKKNSLFSELFNKLNEKDILLLSSNLDYRLNTQAFSSINIKRRKHFNDNGLVIGPDEAKDLYFSKLDKLLIKADKKGINVVLFAPIPVFRGIKLTNTDGYCNKEWFRPIKPVECDENNILNKKSDIQNRFSPINKRIDKLSKKHNNLYIYNVFNYFCPDKICKRNKNKQNLFKDGDHLSNEGALSLTNNFITFLKENKLI